MIKNIRILNTEPYRDMKRMALKTMGKTIRKDDIWDEEWVKKSIISRHSHIRSVFIEIEFVTTKSVRDQLLRSKHGFAEPYVCSARPDRNNGKPRDPDAPSNWIHIFNIEGLIKMMGDRLCMCCEEKTRKTARNLKCAMMMHSDPMIKAIGDMLSPNCVIYHSCKEMIQKDCFGLGLTDRNRLYNNYNTSNYKIKAV